jgi:hypothetical protein
MMVYIIDSRAASAGVPQPVDLTGLNAPPPSGFEARWRRAIASLPGHADAGIVFAQPNDSIQSLIQRVISLVPHPWSIYMLRIVAHGYPGSLDLGTGLNRSRAMLFHPLGHFMTPTHLGGRGIQIHGCNVAEGPAGRAFLQALANAVQMPVSGGVMVQIPDSRFHFEGDAAVIEPQRRRRAR